MSIVKKLFIFLVIPLICFNLIILFVAGIEYWRAGEPKGIEIAGEKGSVILLHGYVGSPLDFGRLPELLAKEGYRVVAPVIPTHSSSDFAYGRGRMRYEDYVVWMKRLIQKERRLTGKSPVVMGFSMGGALSVIAAGKFDVNKLVLIAPYLDLAVLPQLAKPMALVSSWITPVVPKSQKGKINKPEGYAAYEPGTYMLSMSSYYTVEEMKEQAKDVLLTLKIPILVVGSKNDQVARFASAKALCEQKVNCNIVAFEKSNHIIMWDYDAEDAEKAVMNFVRE